MNLSIKNMLKLNIKKPAFRIFFNSILVEYRLTMNTVQFKQMN